MIIINQGSHYVRPDESMDSLFFQFTNFLTELLIKIKEIKLQRNNKLYINNLPQIIWREITPQNFHTINGWYDNTYLFYENCIQITNKMKLNNTLIDKNNNTDYCYQNNRCFPSNYKNILANNLIISYNNKYKLNITIIYVSKTLELFLSNRTTNDCTHMNNDALIYMNNELILYTKNYLLKNFIEKI